MLDVAKVIRRSKDGDFDTVCFFNDTDMTVSETLRTIPGAIGFAGDFVRVVLAETGGPEGADVIENDADQDESEADEASKQVELANLRKDQRQLIRQFPFDVVNLDLERHFFRPKEVPPGNLVKAIRKVLIWQQRPIVGYGMAKEYLQGFTLFITMRVGPTTMGDEHLEMLRATLAGNLVRDPDLASLLEERTGTVDLDHLKSQDFETFFKLAAPKLIAQLLNEEDWYVESGEGIQIFELERSPAGVPPYRLLHLAMQVKRCRPRKDERVPGVIPSEGPSEYAATVRRLFRERERIVAIDNIDEPALLRDLERIESRGRAVREEQ